MAEEDNKTIIAEIAKNIATTIAGTFKKSILSITKTQDRSTTGFLKSAEDLVDENKAKQESFANSLASIRDAIHAAFPKVIESIKTTLAPPTSSEPIAGEKVDADDKDSTSEVIKESNTIIVNTLKERFSTQLTSLNSIVTAITGAPAPDAPTQ